MKIQHFIVLLLLVLVSVASASQITVSDEWLTDTKSEVIDGVTYTIAIPDYNIIMPDELNYSEHYYYLKVNNTGSQDKDWSSDRDDIKPGKTTLDDSSNYQIYLITDKTNNVITFDDSSKNYDKKKYFTIKKDEVKEYVLIFQTDRFIQDEFNITLDVNGASLELDPTISACGAISSAGIYTLLNDITASSSPCIAINSNNVEFIGQGYYVKDTAGGAVSFSTTGRTNVTIRDVEIRDRIEVFGGSSKILINNVTINWSSDVHPAITISGTAAHNVTVSNSNIYLIANNIAIDLYDCDDCSIVNNSIYNQTGTGGYGISFDASDRGNISYNFLNNTARTIRVNNGNNFKIFNNTVETRLYWGVYLQGNSDNNEINNNTICPLQANPSFYFVATANSNTGSGNYGNVSDLDANVGFSSDETCTLPSIIEVTINEPTQDTTYLSPNVTLNFSLDGITADCWKDLDGSITSLGSITGNTTYEEVMTGIGIGDHTVNVSCWDTVFAENVTDSVNFTVSDINTTSLTWTDNVLETNWTAHSINVTGGANVSDINATLWYNGTIYSATEDTAGSWWYFNTSVRPDLVPSNETNYSFYWNLTIQYTDNSTRTDTSNDGGQIVLLAYYINDSSLDTTPHILEGNAGTFNASVTELHTESVNYSLAAQISSTNYSATNLTDTTFQLNFTAPEESSGTNETITIIPWLNVTWNGITRTRGSTDINDTFTNYRLILGNCTGGQPTTPTLNFTFYDEESLASMNASYSGSINITQNGITRTYSSTEGEAAYQPFCIYPSWAYGVSYSTQTFESTGYAQRTYNLNGANLTNTTTNVSLYLVNESTSKFTIITVKTSTGAFAQGAVVTMEHYDEGTGEYHTVGVETTDSQGEASTYVLINEVYYKFTVDYENETQTFAPQKINCDPTSSTCYVTLTLGSGVYGTYSEYYGAISGLCTYENSTSLLVCTALDSTGVSRDYVLEVWKTSTLSTELNCSNSSSDISVTLGCDLGNTTNNTYHFTFYTYIDEDQIILDEGTLDFKTTASFGLIGALIAWMMIFGFAMLGSWNPTVSAILAVIGFGLSQYMELIAIEWGAVGLLVVVVGIFIFKGEN